MSRTLLAAALAGGLLWASNGQAPAQDPKPGNVSPQTQKINELIAKGWESAGIKQPAERAKDHEFMRRAFIDLIGRIPTPEEIIDFQNDTSANKRAKLVHRLLNEDKYTPKNGGKALTSIPGIKMPQGVIDYHDAYAQNFAELWTTWLLTRSNTMPLYRNQLNNWLTTQFAGVGNGENKNGVPWNQVVRELIGASGKGNENGAVIFVIRHLGDPIVAEMGQKTDYNKEGKYDAVPITSRVTKLFLGIQSQCVQCHDHPFNKEYIQSDFWGVNAFFRQTERSGTTNPRNVAAGLEPQVTLSDVPAWNSPGLVLYERRDGQRKASYATMLRDLAQFEKSEPTGKRLVPGNIPERLSGMTRRQILAQWVTEHDNFGKAFVNRMWGHLFGRGLNAEPTVDDFSSNNQVVHPELLDYLAEEFKKYNYDPKKLLEWICTSDAYNLSHVARKEYADPKYDPYFARMPLKAMSPEVMFDSLATAVRAETRKDDAAYRALKNTWTQKLTQNFGDDEGNEVNFNGTVVQALLMMNGVELNREIGSGGKGKGGGGLIEDIMKKRGQRPSEIYDELFLMTVSRHPTADEVKKMEEVRNGYARIDLGPPAPKGTGTKPPPKGATVPIPPSAVTDVTFYQDVLWALLNSNEFMLNH
jgi:hypothetical protein